MEQDMEHLKLLSIFHYVVGGMVALFSCIPLVHMGVGIALIIASAHPGAAGDAPPAFVGWFFAVMAGGFILSGWSMAACVIAAGRYLARKKHRTYCMIVAGVECMFVPFGTVLGVFTIVVLSRGSVQALFESADVKGGPAPRHGETEGIS